MHACLTGSSVLKQTSGGACWAAPPRVMSFLVWNYRGLGNLVTEKELRDLIWAKDPSIMFMAETWTDEARLKTIKRRLNFDHMFFVPQIHRRGGLVLFGRSQWAWEWRHLQKITLTVSFGEVVKEHGGLLASMASQSHTNGTDHGLYSAS